MHQSAGPQLDAAEVAHDYRAHIEHAGALHHVQHRLSGRAGGLTIIGGSLHRVCAIDVVDVGRAMVTGIGKAAAGGVDKRAGFFLISDATNQGNKPGPLNFNFVFNLAHWATIRILH